MTKMFEMPDESEASKTDTGLRTIYGGQLQRYKHEDAARFATSEEGLKKIQQSKTIMFGGCDWASLKSDKPKGGYFLPPVKNMFFQND